MSQHEPERPGRGDRRSQLVDAAVRLIARGGPAALTHRAVAQDAGVANGAVTYYFASRDGIVEAAMREVAERRMEFFRDTWRAVEPLLNDPEHAAAVIAARCLRHFEEEPDLCLAHYELFLEAARRPELRAIIGQWGANYLREVEQGLRRLGSTDPATDLFLIINLVDGAALVWLATRPEGFEEQHLRPLLVSAVTAVHARWR